MNTIKTFLILALSTICISVQAQRVKLTEGSLDSWKNDTAYNIVFNYNGMHVGNYKTEEEYIVVRKKELDEKEPGAGDKWEVKWRANKKDLFEPQFIELFSAFTGATVRSDATHTINIQTIQTNVGYQVAGGAWIGTSKSAYIDVEITVTKTADPSKKVAVITIDGAKGAASNTVTGKNSDGSVRISECYSNAGKALGKFLRKK